MKAIKIAGLLCGALTLSACNTETVYVEEELILPEHIPGPELISEFRNMVYVSIGRSEYYDSMRTVLPQQVDAITDVLIAFANPTKNADGELEEFNDEQIEDIEYVVDLFRRENPDARLLMAFGGWRHDSSFDPVYEAVARDDEARAAFIENVMELVEEYDLDGVDMDWEYPRVEYADEYALFTRELANELHIQGKYYTAAVIGVEDKPTDDGDGAAYLDSVLVDLDSIHLMAYDMEFENHSTYEHAEAAIDYWVHERGADPKKVLLGLPAYSRPGWQDFRFITATPENGGSPHGHPDNACQDTFIHEGEINYYNGLPLIQEKTKLAMDEALGGVMMWEAALDSSDPELSIIATIENFVSQNGIMNYCQTNGLPLAQ
ncbi:glycoside hydrolase family 18 protein [Psychromonas ossibalaenae]|uniref:glycoside hydrolase family 18 protein n=1 Tax=Psychromonas ossibalaenae TaxID=444922 RepID=UPI0003716B09|nr:glycoside hydrolase family 18 protein [Psychromonas ossibalaenae]